MSTTGRDRGRPDSVRQGIAGEGPTPAPAPGRPRGDRAPLGPPPQRRPVRRVSPPSGALRRTAALLLAAALALPGACSKRRRAPADLRSGVAARLGGTLRDAPSRVRLRRRGGRGIPVHPAPLSRRVVARIPSGTLVQVLAQRRGGRWLQIRAPDGTQGWIVRRYVAPDGHAVSRQRGLRGPLHCPLPAAPASLRLEARPARTVTSGGPPRPAAGLPSRLTVASYNVWELYDGEGSDRYLSRLHADALTPGDVKLRVAKLAAALRPAAPHVIFFQEIEHARLACRIARLVAPRAHWRCAAGRWSRRDTPQNLAVASRVGGQPWLLRPAWRFAPRGVVMLRLAGGRLLLLGVHLKSSRGARGARDCPNAQKRQAMAAALAGYLSRHHPRAAALVTGDFNVDPLRASHDRTASLLRAAGLESLRLRFYPNGAPSTYPHYRSTIDLAFFRPAAGIQAVGYRILTDARVDRWSSDHRPVVVTLRIAPTAQ